MIKRALFTLTFLATALPVIAAEQGGGHAEPSLFAGDLGNAIWTLLIFALVLVILGKYAWGPLLGNLQARESFIRESLEKAKREREEAEARLREYEERLATARAEASAIVEEGRRDADVLKRQIEATGKEEAAKMIERAKREIQIATDTATRELYTLSARLATQMAERAIGRELTSQDHERLISEGIQGINEARRN
ncbi:MAG TPA: F0F1 ATP synthase subunit B [Thermoanaerobaculia bacterium]